jgi:hypothetical protein
MGEHLKLILKLSFFSVSILRNVIAFLMSFVVDRGNVRGMLMLGLSIVTLSSVIDINTSAFGQSVISSFLVDR